MNRLFLIALAIVLATPAEARRHHHHYRHYVTHVHHAKHAKVTEPITMTPRPAQCLAETATPRPPEPVTGFAWAWIDRSTMSKDFWRLRLR